jgi:nitroimidazol reductase NimA-like FMN-containing flavoprotein (pyridoxamine 5'-phosphate oxidase superfamily)
MRVVDSDFDIDAFLAKPLMAHLATSSPAGPSETPVWFLWEDGPLWMIASSSSSFPKRLGEQPRAAVGIVDFDLERGYLRHVGFRGTATIEPMDVERHKRLVGRYLGNEPQWSGWFREAVVERQDLLIKFFPETVVARDQSYFRHGDSANTLPALERDEFLRAWHARYPGMTGTAFGYGKVEGDGRSSYAEQLKTTLLSMYNIARFSERAQTQLAAQLDAELLKRRNAGEPAECVLGLRHLVALRH